MTAPASKLDDREIAWLRAWVGYETDAEKEARWESERYWRAFRRKYAVEMFGQSCLLQQQALGQSQAINNECGGSIIGII